MVIVHRIDRAWSPIETTVLDHLGPRLARHKRAWYRWATPGGYFAALRQTSKFHPPDTNETSMTSRPSPNENTRVWRQRSFNNLGGIFGRTQLVVSQETTSDPHGPELPPAIGFLSQKSPGPLYSIGVHRCLSAAISLFLHERTQLASFRKNPPCAMAPALPPLVPSFPRSPRLLLHLVHPPNHAQNCTILHNPTLPPRGIGY